RQEPPELVAARAVGLDEVIHDLVDRPLPRDRRASHLHRRERLQELLDGPQRLGDPLAEHGDRCRRALRPEVLARLLHRLRFRLGSHGASFQREAPARRRSAARSASSRSSSTAEWSAKIIAAAIARWPARSAMSRCIAWQILRYAGWPWGVVRSSITCIASRAFISM